jgi:hypothetical protein
MSWEWQYESSPPRWTLTLGNWSAVVQLVDHKKQLWLSSVEHTTVPLERHEGHRMRDAAQARVWCLGKFAERSAGR